MTRRTGRKTTNPNRQLNFLAIEIELLGQKRSLDELKCKRKKKKRKKERIVRKKKRRKEEKKKKTNLESGYVLVIEGILTVSENQ